jgi:hypothetical protein
MTQFDTDSSSIINLYMNRICKKNIPSLLIYVTHTWQSNYQECYLREKTQWRLGILPLSSKTFVKTIITLIFYIIRWAFCTYSEELGMCCNHECSYSFWTKFYLIVFQLLILIWSFSSYTSFATLTIFRIIFQSMEFIKTWDTLLVCEEIPITNVK